ncbi:MAG: hypothetical protein ABW078_05085 [Sedimenticola sp.]
MKSTEMVDERRIAEASALRRYFQEQWNLLVELVEARGRTRDELMEEQERLDDAIESIVTRTDSRMRAVSRYQKRLRGGTRALLMHIDSLVDELPGSLLINKETFLHDPQISTFFNSMEEVSELCNRFYDMHDYLVSPEHLEGDLVHFILFLRYKEKTVLGSEMQGDILLREVKQTSVVFSNHQLLAPSMTEDEARQALKQILFDNVVRYMRAHIVGLKQDQQQTVSSILHHSEDLRNPEVYLDRILEYLALPKELIRIHENTIRVNRMGIKLSDKAKGSGEAINLSELEIGEDRPQLLSIVCVPREIIDI